MSVPTDSILDKDLYEMFGVLQDASVKDIKTAYRKKALECHPDKNPDNPKANELFHELSRALAVLIDQSARAAYDKVLNAKLAAKKRHQVLDSRRKRFKEELEEKERQAQERECSNEIQINEDKLQKELERLRKLSSQLVEEELNFVKTLIKERKAYTNDVLEENIFRLKIKWSAKDSETNGEYTVEVLKKIFSKYGSVNAIALSLKKKGSALIEFSDRNAAINAITLEKGLVNNPLTISWVGTPPPGVRCENKQSLHVNTNKSRSNSPQPHSKPVDDDDFETAVLRRLKEAEELRKKGNS